MAIKEIAARSCRSNLGGRVAPWLGSKWYSRQAEKCTPPLDWEGGSDILVLTMLAEAYKDKWRG